MVGEMIPSRYKGSSKPKWHGSRGRISGTLRAPRPMPCWHLIDFDFVILLCRAWRAGHTRFRL